MATQRNNIINSSGYDDAILRQARQMSASTTGSTNRPKPLPQTAFLTSPADIK